MSLTKRTWTTPATGSHMLTFTGSVSGATTKLTIVFQAVNALVGMKNSINVYVNGTKQSCTWTTNKTEEFIGNVRKTKMTSSQMTINKPFFTLKLTDSSSGDAFYEGTFSFYEIEKTPTTATCSGGVMDGTTKSKVTFTTSGTDATYKATFTLGSYSGSATSTTKELTYAIPISWCNAIPNATTGKANVVCQVLYGGQVYSSISTTITVSVPASVKPTLSAFTVSDKTDTPVPSSWGIFVQSKSGARVSAITCAGVYSSTIKTIKFAVGVVSVTKDYSTSDLPVISTITQSGNLTAIVTVTDSRGRTATLSKTVSYVPYSNPKFTTVRSERCNSEGGDDIDGTYFLSTTGCEFSSCSNKNSLTLQVQYKKTDASSYGAAVSIVPGTNVCGGDLDTEFSYDVLYTLKDQFTTVTYVDYVSTAVYLMHFLHGGKGVAFGQKATRENTLDCAFDAIFRKSVCFMDSNGVLTPFLSQAAADERYLKLVGGTLTGGLVLSAGDINVNAGDLYAGNTADEVSRSMYVRNSLHTGRLVSSYLGVFGLWSDTASKWVVECKTDGTVTLNGNATSATKDGSGNTITSTYLKLTGGTLTGNLVIGVNTDTDAKVLYLNNVKHAGSIQINTNGTFGAYSHTHSKWVWNCSVGGVSFFNGLADQASKAANGVGLGIGAGSSLSFNGVLCAGMITGGQTVLQFFIPSSRVLSGTPTCTALSIILRHADGGYPYARSGSNGATYTPLGGDYTSIWTSGKTVRTGEIKSISCANKVDGVLVTVTFGYQLAKTSGSTTAVTNNVPASVMATGTITFA